jgi:hypothetical protein
MALPNIASRRVGMAREIAILFVTDVVGTSAWCFSLFFTDSKGYKGSVGVVLTFSELKTVNCNPVSEQSLSHRVTRRKRSSKAGSCCDSISHAITREGKKLTVLYLSGDGHF